MNYLGFDIHLENIEFNDFRGFTTFSYSFVPESDEMKSNITVFISDNGGGKSSILDLIAEQINVLLHHTFLFAEKPYGTRLSKKDVSIIGGAAGCSSKVDWLISYHYKSKPNYENELVDGELEESIDFLLNNKLFYNKYSNSVTNTIVDNLKELDSNIAEALIGDVNISVPADYHLPIFVYFGDNNTNSSGEHSTKSGDGNQRLTAIYDYALNSERSRLKRFTQWYLEKRKLSNEEKNTNLSTLERLLQHALEEHDSALEFSSNLHSALDVTRQLISSQNYNQLEVINTAILQVLNDGEKLAQTSTMEQNTNEQEYRNLRIGLVNGIETLVLDKETIIGLPLEHLSAGEKIIISIVADIAIRLFEANPPEPGMSPLAGTGIVLIDEIDLHLHPKWQKKILNSLIELFPNIQFIVTTHSPQIIQSLDNIQVFNIKSGMKWTGELSGYSISEIVNSPMEDGKEITELDFNDDKSDLYKFHVENFRKAILTKNSKLLSDSFTWLEKRLLETDPSKDIFRSQFFAFKKYSNEKDTSAA
ncbi:MAG TPA: AAA family ATPase [Saprospiraceae bacterium]|nr:AAA family ATPase [Saprospiraceae bacterium]